jgi:hypothetical protein
MPNDYNKDGKSLEQQVTHESFMMFHFILD